MCDKLKFRSLFKITIEPFALLWLKLVELLLLFVFLLDENVPNTQEAADDSANLLMRPLLWLKSAALKLLADIFFVIAFSSSADSLELEHKLVYICLTSSKVMCLVGSATPFSGALYRLSPPLLMLFERHDLNGIAFVPALPTAPAPLPSKFCCCCRFRRLLFRTYFNRPRKCLVPLLSSMDVRLEPIGGIFWISLLLIGVTDLIVVIDLSPSVFFAPLFALPPPLPLAPAALPPPPLRFDWPGRWVAVVLELKMGRITSSGNA